MLFGQFMTKFKFTSKKAIIAVAALLAIILLEAYAHQYVQPYFPPVTSQEKAYLFQNTPENANYTFSYGNSQWLVKLYLGKVSTFCPVSIGIFKISENSSLTNPATGILISNIQIDDSNPDVTSFFRTHGTTSCESNGVYIRDVVIFPSNGTYTFTYNIQIEFYLNSAIGMIPKGELTIPINTTYKAVIPE